jgi:hypothetical protein
VPTEMLADLIARGATVRTVTHPGDRPPEPRYRPSESLAAFVRCRDLTCCFPRCRRLADCATSITMLSAEALQVWTDVSLRPRRTAPLAGSSMPIAQIDRPRTKPPRGAGEFVRCRDICLLS